MSERPVISNYWFHRSLPKNKEKKKFLCFCTYVWNLMFLFVRSMAFWQWTSALSYWNSCSLSSWNAHLEVRDCFPLPHYAAPPVSDSAWVVCPLACTHTHIDTHTQTHTHLLACKCNKKVIWWWCWSVEGFPKDFLGWYENKNAPLIRLYLYWWDVSVQRGCLLVRVCARVCYWVKVKQTTKCKAQRRMIYLQTEVVLQVPPRIRVYVIGRMSHMQVHVDILNIISNEYMHLRMHSLHVCMENHHQKLTHTEMLCLSYFASLSLRL